PRRRLADDGAGGVEALDGELHPLGRHAGVQVVDVAADDRPRAARGHLKLDPEVSIEGLLRVVQRGRVAGAQQRRGRDRESETKPTHRRTSTATTRNHGYRFRVSATSRAGPCTPSSPCTCSRPPGPPPPSPAATSSP